MGLAKPGVVYPSGTATATIEYFAPNMLVRKKVLKQLQGWNRIATMHTLEW